jgi:TPR repeat protein/serine/threonine protein kinase
MDNRPVFSLNPETVRQPDTIRLFDNIWSMFEPMQEDDFPVHHRCPDEKEKPNSTTASTAAAETMIRDAEAYMFGLNSGKQLNPTKAFQLATQAFEMKHPKAAGLVAHAYRTGEGTAQDLEQAKRFARHGFQVDQDPVALLEYLWSKRKQQQQQTKVANKSAANVLPEVTTIPMKCSEDTEEDPTRDQIWKMVERLLERAQNQSPVNAIAMHYISLCYAFGDGVVVHPAFEIEWTQRAAEAGNATSQYNLAEYYRYATLPELDSDKVMYWYRRAAEQGLHDAMFELAVGLMAKADALKRVWKHSNKHRQHHHHHPVNMTAKHETPHQLRQPSRDLAQVADGKGDTQPRPSASEDNVQGTADSKKDTATTIVASATPTAPTTANTNNSNESEACDVCSYETVGTEAVEWLRRAAIQGNANAAFQLALSYTSGHWTPKDDAKAFEWHSCAANANHPMATYNCAIALEHGTGANVDAVRSRQMLEKAARELDCSDAQCYLSQLLLEESYDRCSGIKNPDRFRQDIQLLERSAANGHLGAQMSLLYFKGHSSGMDYQPHTTWAQLQQQFLSGETFSSAAWQLLPPRLDCGDRWTLIAKGRYGSVYRYLLPTMRYLAMKYNNDGVMSSEQCLAELVANLAVGDHPNVIRLVGLACTDMDHMVRGQTRFVYPWAPYGSLNQLFDTDDTTDLKSKPKPVVTRLVQFFDKPDYLLSLLQDTARGLLHLHNKGMIHRDIALRNIVVNQKCRAQIIDLGLARFIDEKDGYYMHRAVHRTLPDEHKQMISMLAERGFMVWNGRQGDRITTWNALDKRPDEQRCVTTTSSDAGDCKDGKDWEKRAVTIVLDNSHPIHEFMHDLHPAQSRVNMDGIRGAAQQIRYFDDLRAFVVEYAEHGVLEQFTGNLKPWQMLRIATDISAVLVEFAQRGLYHGHVTAAHIILGHDMQAKLFGCEFYCLLKKLPGSTDDLVMFGQVMHQLLSCTTWPSPSTLSTTADIATTIVTTTNDEKNLDTANNNDKQKSNVLCDHEVIRKSIDTIISDCLFRQTTIGPVHQRLRDWFASLAPSAVYQRFQRVNQPFVPPSSIPKLVWRQSDDLVAFGRVVEELMNVSLTVEPFTSEATELDGKERDVCDENRKTKIMQLAYEYCVQAETDKNVTAQRLCEILQVRLDLPLLESPILRDKIFPPPELLKTV